MKIEYLGEYETDLYDISIEDNRNFFANDVLVHNCDTDSTYVNFAPLIEKVFGKIDIPRDEAEKFLDKICSTKIEDALEKGYERLAKNMGAYRNMMTMKREKITNRAILVRSKRYIMSTLNSEGVHYEEPKISVTGLESVRSSTPEVCRNKLKEAFKVVLNGTEEDIQKFIADFKELFISLPPEEIAKTSGTDDIGKYTQKGSGTLYKSGCPIHVRGAILYNHFLKERNLDSRYESISSGDKVKFIYLKTPNPIHENVISFPGNLPKELDLAKYIDHDLQFEKVFLKPLETILDTIGWAPEKIDTIEDFFN